MKVHKRQNINQTQEIEVAELLGKYDVILSEFMD